MRPMPPIVSWPTLPVSKTPEQKTADYWPLRSSTSFEEIAAPLDVDFLAQGDLIPQTSLNQCLSKVPSATIKSHHNVGGLPERMRAGLSRAFT